MQKCRMLIAVLLVHCCDANATVATVARAADACDDAMLTCLQIIYVNDLDFSGSSSNAIVAPNLH